MEKLKIYKIASNPVYIFQSIVFKSIGASPAHLNKQTVGGCCLIRFGVNASGKFLAENYIVRLKSRSTDKLGICAIIFSEGKTVSAIARNGIECSAYNFCDLGDYSAAVDNNIYIVETLPLSIIRADYKSHGIGSNARGIKCAIVQSNIEIRLLQGITNNTIGMCNKS